MVISVFLSSNRRGSDSNIPTNSTHLLSFLLKSFLKLPRKYIHAILDPIIFLLNNYSIYNKNTITDTNDGYHSIVIHYKNNETIIRTIITQQQFGFLVLIEICGRYQVSFGTLLDSEQPLSGARPIVNDVELMFVAHAYTACVSVAGRLDQSDD